ncbi:MAG: hemolysin family protein [Chloroflexota bacterium]
MQIALGPLFGLFLVAALLVLNAVFVATEFAYVTVRRTRIAQLAPSGDPAAKSVQRALGNLDFYVAASQLGITMASIALGWFGEPVFAGLIEPPVASLVGTFAPYAAHTVAVVVAFALITGLHIVLGEFVPKTLALEYPDRTALAVSRPVDLFAKLFRPAIWALNATGNALLRRLGMRVQPLQEGLLSSDDLAFSLESSMSAGLISRREFDLTRRSLQLTSLPARELMVSRQEMVCLPIAASEQEAMTLFARHRHTYYPVYGEGIDAIVGVLDAKAALFARADRDGNWQRHVRPAVVLPEMAPVRRVMEAARKEALPLAVLIDEYGGTAGIITVDDVVGRLVEGEDEEVPPAVDGAYELLGSQSIEEVEAALGIRLGPPERDYQTIGGLTMATLGRVPVEGDRLQVMEHELSVLEMQGRRVARVRLRPAPDRATESRN